MNNETLTFEDAVEALAKARNSGFHPQPDELIAYHQGLLDAKLREEISDHIALCRQCASTVLDLKAFPNVPARRGIDCREQEEAKVWKAIQAELNPSFGARAIPRSSSLSFLHYVAACLAMLVVLQGVWVFQLRQTVTQLAGPRGDVYVEDISSLVRRSWNPEITTVVPVGMNRVLWVLNPDKIEDYPRYEATIAGADAPELTILVCELTQLPEKNFTLQVSRDSLPSGRYIIEVFGVRGDERVKQASIPLDLQYSTE